MTEQIGTYCPPDFERMLVFAEETDRHYILRFRRVNGVYAYVTIPCCSTDMITDAWLHNLDEAREAYREIKSFDVRSLEQQARYNTIEVIALVEFPPRRESRSEF